MLQPRMPSLVAALILVVATMHGSAGADTILYVDADAPARGDGQGWQTAFRFLQDALAAVRNGEPTKIRVAEGTYAPDDGANQTPNYPLSSFWLASDVGIFGGYAGIGAPDPDDRDIEVYRTTLTGDLGGFQRAFHVVRAAGVNHTAVLEGFTITQGFAHGSCCQNDRGGGMFLSNGDPVIRRCRFVLNSASNVAAAAWLAGSDPIFESCEFRDNTVSPGNGGAAIQDVFDSHLVLLDCDFIHNTLGISSTGGGAIFVGGFNGPSSVYADGCRFIDNNGSSGGAILNNGYATFVNCLFAGNDALGSGSGSKTGQGGAIANIGQTIIANCVFHANTAAVSGAGVYTGRDSNNSELESMTRVTNTILWGNEAPTQVEDAQLSAVGETSLILNFTIVEGLTGQYGGLGNLDDDPLFVDPDGDDQILGTEDDDLHLAAGSPGLDRGDNWGLPRDSFDRDGDGRLDEMAPLDLDGQPRLSESPGVPGAGCGLPVIVDLGPFEAPGLAAQVIFADLDGDGTVGVRDLLHLLGAWGRVQSDCLPDLDINGAVDLCDLEILLGAWTEP